MNIPKMIAVLLFGGLGWGLLPTVQALYPEKTAEGMTVVLVMVACGMLGYIAAIGILTVSARIHGRNRRQNRHKG